MKSELMLMLELNQEEMGALKKLLGKISDNDKKEIYALTDEECNITSNIWDMIPYDED